MLCVAGQQDHKRHTVTPKIDTVAWAGMNSTFQDSRANAFHFRHVAVGKPIEGQSDFEPGAAVEIFKSLSERAAARFAQILKKLEHQEW